MFIKLTPTFKIHSEFCFFKCIAGQIFKMDIYYKKEIAQFQYFYMFPYNYFPIKMRIHVL